MFENTSTGLLFSIISAMNFASSSKHKFVEPEHLVYGLINTSGIAKKLCERESIPSVVGNSIPSDIEDTNRLFVPFSDTSKAVLNKAQKIRDRMGHDSLNSGHLLLSVFCVKDGKLRAINQLDPDEKKLYCRLRKQVAQFDCLEDEFNSFGETPKQYLVHAIVSVAKTRPDWTVKVALPRGRRMLAEANITVADIKKKLAHS